MKRIKYTSALIALLLISAAFTTQDGALKQSIERGKGEYQGICLACHMDKGQGIPGVFPPLAKSDYLMEDTDRAIKSLIEGLQGEITVNGKKYNQVMPASGLDDQAIADVLNYVMNSWGNDAEEMITEIKVAKVRASLK
jgi:mono/diheme cytochrome c family protein